MSVTMILHTASVYPDRRTILRLGRHSIREVFAIRRRDDASVMAGRGQKKRTSPPLQKFEFEDGTPRYWLRELRRLSRNLPSLKSHSCCPPPLM
jgi:hypothetical protein